MLTLINSNGYLYQPEGNDGYVDYLDENSSAEISIAIDDEGTTSVLRVGVSVDANVQRVVVGPASGTVTNVNALTDTLNEVQLGETGYLLATCRKNGQQTYYALTQDGQSVIKGELIQVTEQSQSIKVFSSQRTVTANGQIKLISGQPTGQITNLPKLPIELSSYGNAFTIKVLHAPVEDGVDGAYQSTLQTTGNAPVYWGDQITELFF